MRFSETNFDLRPLNPRDPRAPSLHRHPGRDDERRTRIGRFSGGEPYQSYQPRRLKHELGMRSDGHSEAEAILEAKRDGLAPFLREKPKNVAMIENQPAQFSVLAYGDPQPMIQWYKNDVPIMPGQRISITENDNGSSILRFEPAALYDCGVYKVKKKWTLFSIFEKSNLLKEILFKFC